MILYGAPGACSQASHIALHETGLPHDYIKVSRDKQTEDGRDFTLINPKGYTPALEMDDGSILTEGLVLLMYIAEKSGKLLAKEGQDRWRTLEALEFMSTELHSNFRFLFYPDSTDAQKEKARQVIAKRFATLATQLGDKTFLIGDQMTIADALLFVMLSWALMLQVELPQSLSTYHAHMKTMPSVAKTLAAEGLA